MKNKLNQLLRLLQTHWLLTVLGLVIILIPIIILIRGQRPPRVTVPPPEITGQVPNKAVRSITYTGQQLILPKTMVVYRNTASELSLMNLVKRIATSRNLPPSPNSSTLWVSGETGEYVHLDQAHGVVTYGQNLPPEDAPAPQTDRARQLAQQWVKDTLSLTVRPDEKNIKYFAVSGSQLVPVDPGSAEVIEIPLNLTIGQYPVMIGNAAIPVATVSVGRNHTINRAILKPFALTPMSASELPTIDLSTIVKNLTDKAEIISIMPEAPIDTNAHPPTEITLTEVQIQYRLDPNTNLIYPYVAFTGTAKLQGESVTADVNVISPVVNTAAP
ncbi:hypothetical protein HYU89_01500 [Candidatus Collierbacteria bacterium]|nr:hypothetical protein [Candidatus Collierbacteria bacterium]